MCVVATCGYIYVYIDMCTCILMSMLKQEYIKFIFAVVTPEVTECKFLSFKAEEDKSIWMIGYKGISEASESNSCHSETCTWNKY